MNTLPKKILIVEDEPVIADDLAYIIAGFGYDITGIALSYDEALEHIESVLPDLVLLDIALKGDDDGIDLAQHINKHYHIPFLFVTSNADPLTINRIKKTKPAGFILKPFKKKELKTQIAIALYDKQTKEETINQRIFVKIGADMVGVETDSILFAKADDNYTYIYTDQHEYCIAMNLKNFTNKLDDPVFFRLHRSYLVNLKKIDKIKEGYVFIKQHKIPVGRAYSKELRRKIQIF